jgi:hypothetical protein
VSVPGELEEPAPPPQLIMKHVDIMRIAAIRNFFIFTLLLTDEEICQPYVKFGLKVALVSKIVLITAVIFRDIVCRVFMRDIDAVNQSVPIYLLARDIDQGSTAGI